MDESPTWARRHQSDIHPGQLIRLIIELPRMRIFRALRQISNVTCVIYQVPDWISGPVSDSVNVSNHQDQGVIPYGGKGTDQTMRGKRPACRRRDWWDEFSVLTWESEDWRMNAWLRLRLRDRERYRFNVLKGSLSKTRGWAKESRDEATRLLLVFIFYTST